MCLALGVQKAAILTHPKTSGDMRVEATSVKHCRTSITCPIIELELPGTFFLIRMAYYRKCTYLDFGAPEHIFCGVNLIPPQWTVNALVRQLLQATIANIPP